MGRMAACRWASDRLTKIIGHARSWSQAKGSGRGVRLSPISTTTLTSSSEWPSRRRQEGRRVKWVTREHPRTDRIACPWLIRKFIDPGAEIVYVPP